jgi:hypothetical protein
MRIPNYLTVIFFLEGGWIPPVSTGTSQTAHSQPNARGNYIAGLQPGYMGYSPINQTARGFRPFSPVFTVQFDFRIDGIHELHPEFLWQ